MRLTIASISKARRRELDAGAESRHLLEWLAVDMARLLQAVGKDVGLEKRPRLSIGGASFAALGITRRLSLIGEYLYSVGVRPGTDVYQAVATHRSDIVRQWAAYALASEQQLSLGQRLRLIERFARDTNMSVREVAWMTFRPWIAPALAEAIDGLQPFVMNTDPNARRFAIEVTRPRSVWGKHLEELKRDPGRALPLLEAVSEDTAKYVRDAAGNWINDAAKTSPRWVIQLACDWIRRGDHNPHTRYILHRGLRTLRKQRSMPASLNILIYQ